MHLADRFAALASTPVGRRALRRALDQAEASARLATRRGHARGGGQSSKAKGRAVVQLVADLAAQHLGISREAFHVKATSQIGVDLYIAPEARARFPYAVEVKGVESLNIWEALAQAQENSDAGAQPILFFKRAKTPLFVALSAETFLALQHRANTHAERSPHVN